MKQHQTNYRSIMATAVKSLEEWYILCSNIILWCVYKNSKMAPGERRAYKADFKVKAISNTVEAVQK